MTCHSFPAVSMASNLMVVAGNGAFDILGTYSQFGTISAPEDRTGRRKFRPERFPVSCLISPVLPLRVCGVLRMPRTGWTPSILPYGADKTVYLVVDGSGAHGTVYRETEVEQTDLETVIADLTSGQFNDPVRVVAVNTLEHWAQDVSKDVALEIQSRSDIYG